MSNKTECTLTDAELIAACNEMVKSLIDTGGRAWQLHVPARPNKDPDLIFTELAFRFKNATTPPIPATVQERIEAEYPMLKHNINSPVFEIEDMRTAEQKAAQFGYNLAMQEKGDPNDPEEQVALYRERKKKEWQEKESKGRVEGPNDWRIDNDPDSEPYWLRMTDVMIRYARYYHSAMRGDAVGKWIDVSERPPMCYKSGNYDGLQSDPILVMDKDKNVFAAVAYAGTLDGSKFLDFYDHPHDFDLPKITHWRSIPE